MFQFTLNTVYGRYVRHRKQHRSLLRGQRTACRYKPRSRDLILTAWVVSSLQCRSSECHLPLKCTNWRFSHAPAPVANTGVSKIFVTLAHSVWLEQPNSVHLGAELFTREVNMLPFQVSQISDLLRACTWCEKQRSIFAWRSKVDGRKFLQVDHASSPGQKFLTWKLTRDLFALANVLVRVRFAGGGLGGIQPSQWFLDPPSLHRFKLLGVEWSMGQKMLHFWWFFPLLQPLCDPKICYKCVCGRGSAPDPAGGAHDAPPDPLVGWGGVPPPHTHPPRRLRHLGLLACRRPPNVFFYKSDTGSC